MSGGVSDSLDRMLRDGRATDCMNFSIGSLLLISSTWRTAALQEAPSCFFLKPATCGADFVAASRNAGLAASTFLYYNV